MQLEIEMLEGLLKVTSKYFFAIRDLDYEGLVPHSLFPLPSVGYNSMIMMN